MRAVVDIGSNTIKYSLADFSPPQTDLEILESKSWMTRLGKGIGTDRLLKKESLDLTEAGFGAMAQRFKEQGVKEIRVLATSAVRDAKNSYEVHKMVEDYFQCPLFVIPGHIEAELSFSGARFAANKIYPKKKALFVDVGGASTEVGFMDQEELRAKSFQAGGVRCMEALGLQNAPCPDSDWERAQNDIANFFPIQDLNALIGREVPDLGIGIGGSLMAAAKASGAQKLSEYGYFMKRDDFEKFNDQLRKMSLQERELGYGIEKGRSDIVCTGLLCLNYVMKHFRLTDLVITSWGLRHGVFLNWNHPFFSSFKAPQAKP